MSISTTEKVMLRISGIHQVEEKRVEVILADTGDKIWLPISEAERFGTRVFIPLWLARKYGFDNGEKKPVPRM